MKKLLGLIRTLHLYFGLFISPFILIFSLSVLAFNHMGLLNRINPVRSLPEIRTRLDSIPHDTTALGRAKTIISKLGINGEIDFISENADQISFPVNKPHLKTSVVVNTHNKNVLITRQREGSVRAMNWLHIMPGPHNAAIRGNSLILKLWRIIADFVVYLLIFLVLSGTFLWYFLKFGRDAGVYALILGIVLFIVLLSIII